MVPWWTVAGDFNTLIGYEGLFPRGVVCVVLKCPLTLGVWVPITGVLISGVPITGVLITGGPNCRGPDYWGQGSQLQGSWFTGFLITGSQLQGSQLQGSQLQGVPITGGPNYRGPQCVTSHSLLYCNRMGGHWYMCLQSKAATTPWSYFCTVEMNHVSYSLIRYIRRHQYVWQWTVRGIVTLPSTGSMYPRARGSEGKEGGDSEGATGGGGHSDCRRLPGQCM